MHPLMPLLLLISFTVNAATVYKGTDALGAIVVIDGEIKHGDLKKVKRVAYEIISSPSYNNLNIHLNSKGGDVKEAMLIGNLFRELLATVTVYGNIIRVDDGIIEKAITENPKLAILFQYDKRISVGTTLADGDIRKCYSSCVFIFYGAVNRHIRDNVDQRDGYLDDRNSIPVIGIHRPYYENDYYSDLTPMEAQKAYKDLAGMVRSYLLKMGAPLSFIERMFKKSSK